MRPAGSCRNGFLCFRALSSISAIALGTVFLTAGSQSALAETCVTSVSSTPTTVNSFNGSLTSVVTGFNAPSTVGVITSTGVVDPPPP
jgi:hypothetical protein